MPNYRSLDSYRFFAASMVAFGHFNAGFHLGLEQFTSIGERYRLFVDFFFVLSGFVIALNYRDRLTDARSYASFLWRRVARLWPLHLLVLAAFGTLGGIGHIKGYSFNYPEAFSLSDLPWNAALLHAWGPVWHMSFNSASWSISAEFFVYLCFPLLAFISIRLGFLRGLVLIAVYIALMTLAREAAGLQPWHEASYDLGMLRAVPSFFLGMLIEAQVRAYAGRITISWWQVHTTFALVLVAFHLNVPAEAMLLLFGLLIGLAALAEANQPRALLASALGYHLGQASYALYLIHMPIMTCMLFVMRRSTGAEGIWPWVFSGAAYGVALIGALLIYRYYEDPVRRWLNARWPLERRGPTRGATAGSVRA